LQDNQRLGLGHFQLWVPKENV